MELWRLLERLDERRAAVALGVDPNARERAACLHAAAYWRVAERAGLERAPGVTPGTRFEYSVLVADERCCRELRRCWLRRALYLRRQARRIRLLASLR